MYRFGLAGVLNLFVIHLVEPSIPYSFSDDISWKLLTKPAVFGNGIILDCRLPKKACCERYTRKWLGGHALNLLVMNGVSTIPEKYSEVFKAESRSSKLTIHTLNSSDVDIPYACTYGFEMSAKILKLSEDIFEMYPSEPYEVNVTTERGHFLSSHIKLQPVYPKPNCTATFDGADISDFVTENSLRKDSFYIVVINLKNTMVSKACPGVFDLVCNIGTKRLDITRHMACSDDSSSSDIKINEETGIWLIILVCIIVILFVLVIVGAIFVKKSCLESWKGLYSTVRMDYIGGKGGNAVEENRLVHNHNVR